MLKKPFAKGFVKGILFLLGYLLFLVLTYIIFPKTEYYDKLFQIFGWIFWMIVISFLVIKNRLPFGYAVVGLILSVLILPFLFGAIEQKKAKILQQKPS